MTERKPPGVDFESFVDKQIREAAERGEFERLPGFGKPLDRPNAPYDESWWIKEKMAREQLSFLPPSLALRKEAEDAREAATRAPSERMARRIVEEINEKIRAALARPPEGPPLNLVPYDVEDVVASWRAGRERRTS
ncbi:DnaJ family domain-containing protein [Streptomyces buecherae]|uniref:DnaJ family domain-containing protein n=1 Tax=Streptomyces buecherae TaxID=2763006 RepID=UPI003374B1D5